MSLYWSSDSLYTSLPTYLPSWSRPSSIPCQGPPVSQVLPRPGRDKTQTPTQSLVEGPLQPSTRTVESFQSTSSTPGLTDAPRPRVVVEGHVLDGNSPSPSKRRVPCLSNPDPPIRVTVSGVGLKNLWTFGYFKQPYELKESQ